MRILFSIMLLLHCFVASAQPTDTSLIHTDGHSYYLIQREGHTGLIIFLHGGVDNPAFSDVKNTPALAFLLEGNTQFIATCLAYKFDVLIPVVDDSLNWLTNYNYCFQAFKKQLDSSTSYSKRFIGGFSDGGTGSYRIFYNHSDYFNGLLVFNGYPQHQNFNKSVQYANVSNKKVVFCSTEKDNVIPYEFVLTEYCKQKTYNPDTYLYIVDGSHTFNAYGEKDFKRLFDIINLMPDNTETKAIHGFVTQDKLVAFYPFRSKIFRKYNYGKEFYEENIKQSKIFQ